MLTHLEQTVIKAFEYFEDNEYRCFVHSLEDEVFLDPKQVRGVIPSLVKKGLAVHTDMSHELLEIDRCNIIHLTEKGQAVLTELT